MEPWPQCHICKCNFDPDAAYHRDVWLNGAHAGFICFNCSSLDGVRLAYQGMGGHKGCSAQDNASLGAPAQPETKECNHG